MSQEPTPYYDVTKTIYKGLKAIGVFGSGAGAAIIFPEPGAHWTQWAMFVLLCLPSLFDAFMNYTKHSGKGSPATPPPALGTGLVFFLCVSLALSGCAGLPSPALSGKTKYEMRFDDTVSEIKDETGDVVAPGQDTSFFVKFELPGGVDAAGLASMKYKVNPDGTVDIAVASDTDSDTNGQAAMLTEISRQQLEAFKAGMDAALNTLAPMLGPYLQSKDNRAAINAASDADIAEIVREAIGAKE